MSSQIPPQTPSANPKVPEAIPNPALGLIAPIDDLIRLSREIPGAAERLIAMAEEEGRHRRELEREEFIDRSRRADLYMKAQLADTCSGVKSLHSQL